MLQTIISSDLDKLDELNKKYPWIPNSNSIRPKKEIIEKKILLSEYIHIKWRSYTDYIYHEIFHEKYYIDKNEKNYVDIMNLKNNIPWSFQESKFAYDINPITNHWILWNSEKIFSYNFPTNYINKIILDNLKIILGDISNCQFVWYKNPKPTILEFYHVQVFWINVK